MRALVTGASGHLGCNLVRGLLEHGYQVRALIHISHLGLEGLPIEQASGDLSYPATLVDAMRDVDIVFNCAGYISILRSEGELLNQVNVEGVRRVIEACQVVGVRRLVHISTIHALVQEPLDKTLDESRQFVAGLRTPPYDLSKAVGELAVREAVSNGLDAVIINPTGIIGPNDYRPSHMGQVLINLCKRRMPALVDAGFDWVDVRDVVEGAIAAAEQAPSGEVYLLSGHWESFDCIGQLVEEITGIRTPRFMTPLWLSQLVAPYAEAWASLRHERALMTSVSLEALHSNRKISHAKATDALGYHTRPFKETIEDTLRFYATHGMIEPF